VCKVQWMENHLARYYRYSNSTKINGILRIQIRCICASLTSIMKKILFILWTLNHSYMLHSSKLVL
jgi:hypothetical protein